MISSSRPGFVLFGVVLVLLASLLIVGCTPTVQTTGTPVATAVVETATVVVSAPSATPETAAAATGVVISEVIPGIAGENNNFEFIELYNAETETVALKGWSLWYQMSEQQAAQRLVYWGAEARIPGYGHYLLVREGQDVGVPPDGAFAVPLFERWGGLQLRNPAGEVVDAVGWGEKAPPDFVEGAPAAVPEGGASLERAPGGEAGHGQDSGDSRLDFVLRPMPLPQNSGMATTPLPETGLAISITAPVTASPGTEFELTVTVENSTGEVVSDMQVVFPMPPGVTFVALTRENGAPLPVVSSPVDPGLDLDVPQSAVVWAIPSLEAGHDHMARLTVRSPWRYGPLNLRGYYVTALHRPLPPSLLLAEAFGPFVPLLIEGGAIPVDRARTLVGETVTIEGVATMYTGGFYAGSTGTKFYLEDESGGIQVYCPGGKSLVSARIGDRVRVTGKIEVYRDSVEIIPQTYPDDVEVLGKVASDEAAVIPTPVSVFAATHDETVLGRLIEVTGRVTRFEEFGYSYELDLIDEQGDAVLIYLEKDTRVNPEFVEVGDTYRVTGISEIYDGQWQLKPRLSEDFSRVYPPELLLEITAPNSVEAGGLVTYTLTASNHTTMTLTAVTITASPAYPMVELVTVSGDGDAEAEAGSLSWTAATLAPEGGAVSVSYTVQVQPEVDGASFEAGAAVTAAEWPAPVTAEPWLTFVGEGVPIWAIQGPGTRSPFALSRAATTGVVIGVFPELDGFWIQSLEPDDDPATSEGLFVLAQGLEVAVQTGDYVSVSGKVRERSGQTLLHLASAADVEVVETGVALPEPVELDPPQDEAEARAYYEALEGMLVAVTEPALAVGPTSQYGETPLVLTDWAVDRVMKGEPKGLLIFADDGSTAAYTDRSQMPYAVKTGDQIGDLLGPLAFTYENYKIQPISAPTVITSEIDLPAMAALGDSELSVATFNVENMFDIFDPHPADLARPSLADYKLDLTKVAATVVAMGAPTIVGLQEVENVRILEDLVAQPALLQYGYIPVLIEGFDSRGIDVGYLVRGDRATLQGAAPFAAPEGLTSRPPLMITVTLHFAGGDQMLYVLNNHFTSMSGGELATEPRRVAQARWNAALVAGILAEQPESHVIVLGDLNSFYRSPPLDALRAAELRHVYELVEPDLPYTYIYQGESETLDHILVTPFLYDRLVRVAALHVNADYPPPEPGDASPQGASDHDPLVAVFEFR